MRLFLLMVFISVNSIAAPCNGALGKYHSNLDGSNGGFVQTGARVSRGVYISVDSEICGKVIIEGTPKIEAGSRIEENVVIQGNSTIVDSHIFGNARISGRSIVEKSEICQASIIDGIKVINSKFYCQTEDPAPKDPGASGKITLLGVDSDGDGVRDDIEVFINNKLSNTSKKDFSQERISMKNYSRILQKEIIIKENGKLVEFLKQEKTDLLNCYPSVVSNEIFVNMYNTKERLFAMFKIVGHLHGKSVKNPNIKCKEISMYNPFR